MSNKHHDNRLYLWALRGVYAEMEDELEELQENLKTTVLNSLKALPDPAHKAHAAQAELIARAVRITSDMIDAAFKKALARLRQERKREAA